MGIQLTSIHHVAIICSDYARSKWFYTELLGLNILAENYREERKSWKLDLGLRENYVIELFSFPEAPARRSRPEACGLRHLAFAVDDLEKALDFLHTAHWETEAIRVDEYTGKRFCFFADPDGLPIEFYES
jgi:glyoxylase I family protein